MPDCLALLVPAYRAPADELEWQAAWLKQTFGERAWIALTLLHGSRDEAHRATVEQVAHRTAYLIMV